MLPLCPLCLHQVCADAVREHSLLAPHHPAVNLVKHVGMRIAQVCPRQINFIAFVADVVRGTIECMWGGGGRTIEDEELQVGDQ